MSSAITPLTTVRLYRQIAERIRGLILEGRFAVGERLPAERDLALQLGVSRPSVREALIALEVQGLIEVRTGSGIYVARTQPVARAKAAPRPNTPERLASNDWGPLEVLSARLLIEGETAALAATHATRREVQAIAAALTLMKREAKAGHPPRHGDEAFHLAIAQASNNSVMLDTLRQYWSARDNALFQRLGEYFEHAQSWQLAIAEHQLVYEHIRDQQPSAARRAMQSHLRKAFQRYSAGWRRAPQ